MSAEAITDGDARQPRSFQAVERFLAEAGGPDRRPGYLLLGDEAFLYGRLRAGVLAALVPPDCRQFCLHDLDLAETSIFEALDTAQSPSLMAPFQVIFVRNVKVLFGRGSKKEEFAAIADYFRRPNSGALLIFVADHLSLPADLRRMDFAEKEKAERMREVFSDVCGVVELGRVTGEDATVWLQAEALRQGKRFGNAAARELVEAVGTDMLSVASELEKLLLEAGARGAAEITVRDVETMVPSAKQRSLHELTDAISSREPALALALLGGLLNASDGEDAAIGHVFSLAKTYRQMILLNERQVKDQRAMWQVLWPGMRVAPHAADALIAQARRYKNRADLEAGLRAIAKADLELRSSPPDKRLVLERLVLRLAGRAKEPGAPHSARS